MRWFGRLISWLVYYSVVALWCVNGVWMGSKIAAVVGLCRLVLSVCRSVWTVFFGFAEFAG